MAGDWIKIEHATLDKPEVIRLADLLGVTPEHALGLLLKFWVWIDRNVRDDSVTQMFAKTVDTVTHCSGFSAGLVAVGWAKLDERSGKLTVSHIQRHHGNSAKTRALSRDRMQRLRDVSVTQTTSPEKRREEKSNTKSNTNTARRRATPLSPDFQISDRVRQWAADKGHMRLDERLAHFKSACRAKGYTYVDWDDAFMNAVRDDWAKFTGKQQSGRAAVAAAIFGDKVGTDHEDDPRDISGEATRVA